MGFWKIACACAGCAAGALCVVATGGATAPLVGGLLVGGGGLGGFLIGDKADKESAEREKTLLQNQQYKDAKNEIERQENQNNSTADVIDTITGKLNGNIPRQPNETDEYLRNQLIIHESQLSSGKSRLSQLRSELDKIRKESSGFSLMGLLGLDKLSFTDKVMIVGGIILVIWLLKG